MPEHDPSNLDIDFVYTELEIPFVQQFLELFARVDAQQPNKGIRALVLRARRKAEQSNISPQAALTEVYEDAVARTERRLQLLQQCALKQNDF